MSLTDGRILIHESNGAHLFPWRAFEAVTMSYEPGDPIGYGPTPEAAVDDLMELIHLHLMYIDEIHPQIKPS